MHFERSLVPLLIVISILVVVSGCTTNTGEKYISPARSIQLESIPDNAEIIFWSTRDVPTAHILGPSTLFVMDSTGGNVKAITLEPKHYQHAAVSPDRKFIVTSLKVTNGGTKIFILNLENQTEQQLVPNFTEAGNGGVDWSIDGWIYFSGLEGPHVFGGSDIYRIRPDGSGLTRLTNNPNIGMYDVSISEDGSLITHAAISPFMNSKGETCAKSQIWILNSDGRNHKLITSGGDECGSQGPFPLGDYDPEISPDNEFVVFSRSNNEVPMNFPETLNSSHDIWIVPIDGSSSPRRISKPGSISIIPDWKDKMILYTEYDEKGKYVGLVTMVKNGNSTRIEEGQHGDVLHGGRHGKWIPE